MTEVYEDPKRGSGSRRRRVLPAILTSALLVSLLAIPALLVAGTARQAQAQATDLKVAIDQVQAGARNGQLDTLSANLASVDTASQALAATTETWQWSVLEHTPGLQTTARAVPVLTATVQSLVDAVQPIADAADAAPSTLALVEQLPQLQPAVEELQQVSRHATQDLQGIETTDLQFGLADQIASAAEVTQGIDDATTSALEAWPSLSGLLGFDQPRTYLVMLQNPAEARGSGGLFSAFMRVTFDQGAPTIEEGATRKAIDDTRIPVPDDIDPGEKAMWGDYLTKWASFNTSPDFPTTASLARAGMNARGTPVDGVIAIDPYAVEALLAGTGPVEHKGVTIDASMAADFFTQDIYTDYPAFADVEAKDELALGLLFATVDSALKRPLDVKALADRIPAAIDEGHIRAWAPDPDEQAWLDEIGVAHQMASADPQTPFIVLNNATGGKIDAYVNTAVRQQNDTCVYADGEFEGWTQSTISVSLTNYAPPDLPPYVDVRLDDEDAPKGSTKILVTVFGPPGVIDEDVTSAGEWADYTSGQAYGRPYWLSSLELKRGESKDMTITYADPSTENSPAAGTTPCKTPVD